jgi:hypothetical protein
MRKPLQADETHQQLNKLHFMTAKTLCYNDHEMQFAYIIKKALKTTSGTCPKYRLIKLMPRKQPPFNRPEAAAIAFL